MFTTTHVIPIPEDVRAWMFDGARKDRLRALLCVDGHHRIELMVNDRAVLGAFLVALDEIRADMDAAEVVTS